MLAVIGAVAVGVISIPLEAIWPIVKAKVTHTPVEEQWQLYELTLWNLRLPRVLLSVVTGASLALCGAAFQSIFRNPICDPYILGISSGASLGAAIAIILGLNTYIFGITLCALIASLLTLAIVLTIAHLGNRKSVETILLAGVAINFLVSAIITLLMVLHQESLDEIVFWTMGSFGAARWNEILILAVIFCVIGSILFAHSKELNIMQLGRDVAQTSGVQTQRVTLVVLISSSLLIATAVAFSGVIGFIGLIVPHIVRLLFGNDNRRVFSFSILLGAFFCLIADTLARTVAAPAELPVGSVTALAGAPYFLYLLIASKWKSVN